MKLRGLVLVTLLTGAVLPQAGWFAQSPSSPPLRCVGCGGNTSPDPVTAGTLWRLRHNQPTHWRACLLQR